MTGEDKLCESPSHNLTLVPFRAEQTKRNHQPLLEIRVIHRRLTLCSLLADIFRDQLYRLGAMDEDAAKGLQHMLRDLRAEHELLCMLTRERLNLGWYTI